MQFSIGGTCSVIIYGMRTTESTLGQGLFACPNCRTQQACRHVVMNRWFTLYFIPVIPLGNIGEQFECQGCYARFTADAPGMTPGMAPALTPGSPTTPQPAAGPAWSGQPYAPQAAGPPTAPFATLSLVLGLISPVLLCACGLSALTSLGAIISGHIALAKIAKSKGVLTGRGMAISGLVLGYVLLAFSILFWVRLGPSIFRAGDRAERGAANADVAQTPEDRLLETELRVLTASTEGVATGNTRAAKEIAGEYAESLKSMRDDLFTKDRERVLSLTDGHFIVHCELHADRCALIVHVPGYRDFTSDAKKTLEELAWILAQKAAQGKVEPGADLAVGLRGTALYGAVMVGKVGADADDFRRKKREALVAFFRDDEPAAAPPEAVARPEAAQAGPADIARNDVPGVQQSRPPLPFENPPFPVPGVAPGPGGPFEPPIAATPPNGLGAPSPFTPPTAPRESRASSRPRAPEIPPAKDVEIVRTFPGLGWTVQSLTFAPGGRFLAVGKLDDTLLMLDVEGGGVHSEPKLNDLGQVTAVAFSPDGSKLFAGGYRGTIRAWNVDGDGRLTAAGSLSGHSRQVMCLVVSPAARFIASGSQAGDLIWQSYDEDSSQAPRTLAAFDRNVEAIHLPQAPGPALATDGRKLIHFDLRTGQNLRTFDLGRGSPSGAAFSRDGQQLAVCFSREIKVFSAQTGAPVATFAAPESQYSVAFSADGQRLISGSRGTVNVWQIPGGQPESIDIEGTLYVKSLAVSSDGKLLAAIPASSGQTLSVVRLPPSP